MYCILFFDLWWSSDQTRGRVTLNATYRAVAKKWWMKTRRSSAAAAVLEFTARERESKDGKGKRENEDAAERNVEEKRDNRVKWRRENGRERERIWDEGKEGGATIKPNRLELFDPHPTAHKHTHTHTHTITACLREPWCVHVRRQEINRALGRVCMSVSDVLATCWWRHVPC